MNYKQLTNRQLLQSIQEMEHLVARGLPQYEPNADILQDALDALQALVHEACQRKVQTKEGSYRLADPVWTVEIEK